MEEGPKRKKGRPLKDESVILTFAGGSANERESLRKRLNKLYMEHKPTSDSSLAELHEMGLCLTAELIASGQGVVASCTTSCGNFEWKVW
jgi:hypothetical protein